jgi:hypothetical protein
LRAGDPVNDQRAGARRLVTHLDGAGQGGVGAGQDGIAVGPQFQQRLAGFDPLPRLGVAQDASRRADRVFLAGAARAQAPGGHADGPGVQAAQPARRWGRHHFGDRSAG